MSHLLETIAHTENAGRTHLFLGHPMSDGADKTVVEPGNTTSPGVWTCGISIWWGHKLKAITPDIMPPEAITWGFGRDNGLPPVVTSRYCAFDRQITHELVNLGADGSEGVDFHRVTANVGSAMQAYIAIKSVGPAGRKIQSIDWNSDEIRLIIDGGIQLRPEVAPNFVHVETIDGEPVAVLGYDVHEGQAFELRFTVLHRFHNCPMGNQLPISRFWGMTVEEGFERALLEWKDALPARIFSPDDLLAKTWERCCAHILNAMELGMPRIGAVHYPLFWMRDGVLVLRALDLMGRHDLARIGCDALTCMIYAGGFGAEADAPGEGIWALTAHARMTNDTAWLQSVFPMLEKRVAIIQEMITTDKIIRGLSECRAPMCTEWPTSSILCFPSFNGCINGRMDHHQPNFYINMWAWRGLCDASAAARLLGKKELAGDWQRWADTLAQSIEKHLLPSFGTNERDGILTPHPCGTVISQPSFLPQFKADFYARRVADGSGRRREALWTYFEAAQIHNALLMGIVDEAWICLRGMMQDGPYDTTVYTEGGAGDPEHDLKFGNGAHRRGWLSRERSIAGNMPHNWTNAEMVTLIRDIFVCEEEGVLFLGKGAPREWLQEGKSFGVTNLPTSMGSVSYTARYMDGNLSLIHYKGPQNYILYHAKENE